jgi:hypothetical protein
MGEHDPPQRAAMRLESEPVRTVRAAGPDPNTLADLVARLCRQIHSIADEADRACGRARDDKNES